MHDGGAAPGPRPASRGVPRAPDDEVVLGFDELYDAEELAAIEAGPTSPTPPPTEVGSWRRRSALGAVLTGLALGLREIFEPEPERSIVIEADADQGDDERLQVYLDPDSPPGSRVVVRADTAPPAVPG